MKILIAYALILTNYFNYVQILFRTSLLLMEVFKFTNMNTCITNLNLAVLKYNFYFRTFNDMMSRTLRSGYNNDMLSR